MYRDTRDAYVHVCIHLLSRGYTGAMAHHGTDPDLIQDLGVCEYFQVPQMDPNGMV